MEEQHMATVEGKVAVITGAGGAHSIGRATARLFAEKGAKVVLADIDEAALRETVKELADKGYDVLGVPTDVARLASVQALADTVWGHYGQVDIAFLNAGIDAAGTLFDDAMDEWHRVFDVNFFGILHGIKAFAPRMIAQGTPGDIIGTTSGAGTIGVQYQTAAYATSKSAVCTLVECLYGQLRDLGSLIRVHVMMPRLARSGLAGNPAFMEFVQQGLVKGGVPAVLAEPEEVAVTALEAVERGSFWAHHDHEADQRLSGGRFASVIDWEHQVIRDRAEAIIGRTAPDSYLWGLR
jgi:NAD(P)-dependent dehydrogenase (short-subunit alcohol dehydrogenase family)